MSQPGREPPDDLSWLTRGIASVARIHVLLDRSAPLVSTLPIRERARASATLAPLSRPTVWDLRQPVVAD